MSEGLPQRHWVLAVAQAGDYDWTMPMLLLGLDPGGSWTDTALGSGRSFPTHPRAQNSTDSGRELA